jgi:hypothetical protein
MRCEPGFEAPLLALENCLHDMGLALRGQDAAGVERIAAELQAALGLAISHFAQEASQGPVPAPMRQRLALAGAQVAAQREALARATASLDRAIDVLIPRHVPDGLYSAAGGAERTRWPGAGMMA